MADAYQMKLEDVKKYMTDSDTENIRENLKVQKAVKFLVDNAKFVEPKTKEDK